MTSAASAVAKVACPGCGLVMPRDGHAVYEGDYHASPECWTVYTEVLGAEFGDAVLFGRVHQLTVDAYALQHAGGRHPPKSIGVHLCGLHLALERGIAPVRVAPLLQRLASRVEAWPQLEPPPPIETPTVLDVALAGGGEEHARRVAGWARVVWAAWAPHHARARGWAGEHLALD